jgi:hypothetical protein
MKNSFCCISFFVVLDSTAWAFIYQHCKYLWWSPSAMLCSLCILGTETKINLKSTFATCIVQAESESLFQFWLHVYSVQIWLECRNFKWQCINTAHLLLVLHWGWCLSVLWARHNLSTMHIHSISCYFLRVKTWYHMLIKKWARRWDIIFFDMIMHPYEVLRVVTF